jgi:hypothetical protein
VANRHVNAVELLLECGAKVNVLDGFGCTPLHFAIYGLVEKHAVELLLAHAQAGHGSLLPMDLQKIGQGIDKVLQEQSPFDIPFAIAEIVKDELKNHGLNIDVSIMGFIAHHPIRSVKTAKAMSKKIGADAITEMLKMAEAISKEIKKKGVDIPRALGVAKATLISKKEDIMNMLPQGPEEGTAKIITEHLLRKAREQGIDVTTMLRNERAVAVLKSMLEIAKRILPFGELCEIRNIIRSILGQEDHRALLERYGVDVGDILRWWEGLFSPVSAPVPIT